MGILNINAASSEGKPVTIYALVDPRDKTAFYVGATIRRLNMRLSGHLNDAVHLDMRGERYQRIRDITDAGARPDIIDLETVGPKEWGEAEHFWIANLRFLGSVLTNVSTGGPGAIGAKQTQKTKLLRQRAAAGRDMSYLHTPEARAIAHASMGNRVRIGGVEYPSTSAAGRALGKSPKLLEYYLDTGRGERLEGNRKGYRRELPGRPSGKRHGMARAVVIDGVEYWGLTAAAAALSVNVSTVFRWLGAGRAKYADGSDATPPAPKILKGRPTGEAHHNARAVIVNGKRYWGASGAVAALGVSRATIARWLKSGRAQYAPAESTIEQPAADTTG